LRLQLRPWGEEVFLDIAYKVKSSPAGSGYLGTLFLSPPQQGEI